MVWCEMLIRIVDSGGDRKRTYEEQTVLYEMLFKAEKNL